MGRVARAVISTFQPMTRRLLLVAVAVAATAAGAWLAPSSRGPREVAAALSSSAPPRGPYPAKSDIREAKRVAAENSGLVSFAVIGPDGRVHGTAERQQYSAASVTKAMLLAAYLRSQKGSLDDGIRSTLRAMVSSSDNDAAATIYAIVGDEGLVGVARRAGMRDFEPDPGFWGGAQISAADMAKFFYRLDRNLAGPHRGFGKELLASIIPGQRWGVPAAAGEDWKLFFKGGWRPGGEGTTGAVSHQAGQLVHESGTRIAIAVLSDLGPGEGAGYSAIEEITRRLINPPPG